MPPSCSVLSFEVQTRKAVARLRGDVCEVLCHLPMQPANDRDPGPGALREAMGLDALAAATRRALGAGAGGV